MQKYQFLEHTADIKFKAFGQSLEEVFSNCAIALTKAISEENIKSRKTARIKVRGKDLPNLLYNFLEEFLLLFDSKGFIFSKISYIKINSERLFLDAEISGDEVHNYKTHAHVKAVTYNDMFIKKRLGGWVAQVVLDV